MIGVPVNYRVEYHNCKVLHVVVRERHLQSVSHDQRHQAPPALLILFLWMWRILGLYQALLLGLISRNVTYSLGKVQTRTCVRALHSTKFYAALVSYSYHMLWELSMNQLGKKRV